MAVWCRWYGPRQPKWVAGVILGKIGDVLWSVQIPQDQTNLYALQEKPNKPLKLNVNELEQFIGTLLAMSMVKLSNSRLYWSNHFQCEMVTEAFSRNRWEQIKSNLHCNDNSQAPKYGDPNYDKLYKIRPLINHLQSKFRKIPMPQMLCVDEQLVPFKGKSSLKHYIPIKPHKWGYKIMALCGSDGVLYDFHVCDGPLKPVEGEPDLGASSNIVLQLAQTIPVGLNHLLYHDNWFTSLPLVTNLAKKQIYCLGTVRQVRLPGVPFHTDKELMKKGRGTHEEVSTLVDGVEVRAVKWLDNKCVNLLSTFSSALPLEECKRFDKKKKEITMIPCPAIVKVYNKFMGGVDLMDSLIALYRIHTRSKKYYHKLISHFIDVSIVNAWLLYRRDSKAIGLIEKNIMMLQEFKMLVAKALLRQGPSKTANKRGRPSTSIDSMHAEKKRKGHATQVLPGSEIRS
nr:piggyBac transposable element-derived protein 3-like [Lepeophtheirus salmonis]